MKSDVEFDGMGWVFWRLGGPWVAHLVWATATWSAQTALPAADKHPGSLASSPEMSPGCLISNGPASPESKAMPVKETIFFWKQKRVGRFILSLFCWFGPYVLESFGSLKDNSEFWLDKRSESLETKNKSFLQFAQDFLKQFEFCILPEKSFQITEAFAKKGTYMYIRVFLAFG